jgi:hypothetical protein
LGDENKNGRRSHLRVSVVPPAAGLLRTLRAVDVESENGSELLVISPVPGVSGEELAIEVGDSTRTHMLQARVTESRIAVVEGAVQYRLRVRVTTPRKTAARPVLMDDPSPEVDRVGFLVRDISVRLLDCSPAGGLFEASQRIEVGSVGSLHLTVHDRQILAHILVARSQAIEGAGARWLVGCQFLWFGLPNESSLRRAFSGFTPPAASQAQSPQP